MNKTGILASIMGLLVGAIIAYAVTYLSIPNQGLIQTPPNIIATPNTVNWGIFTIGANETWNIANINITLTNNGDETTKPLFLSNDWQDPLGTLSWNCTDYILPGHKSVIANFILTIDTATTYTGTFSFNIIISG